MPWKFNRHRATNSTTPETERKSIKEIAHESTSISLKCFLRDKYYQTLCKIIAKTKKLHGLNVCCCIPTLRRCMCLCCIHQVRYRINFSQCRSWNNFETDIFMVSCAQRLCFARNDALANKLPDFPI